MIGINKVSGDDALMKAIFDHLRNWVLSGVMLAAAAKAGAHLSEKTSANYYITFGGVTVVVAMSLWLLLVNSVHAHRKLEEAGMAGLARLLIMVVCGGAMGLVVTSIVLSQLAR